MSSPSLCFRPQYQRVALGRGRIGGTLSPNSGLQRSWMMTSSGLRILLRVDDMDSSLSLLPKASCRLPDSASAVNIHVCAPEEAHDGYGTTNPHDMPIDPHEKIISILERTTRPWPCRLSELFLMRKHPHDLS